MKLILVALCVFTLVVSSVVSIPSTINNDTDFGPSADMEAKSAVSPVRQSPVLRRPLYNIAHMVNSLKEIDDYLARGANAFETDVYFAPNATPAFVFHGHPCDCFRHCGERERFDVYLGRIRELTSPDNDRHNPRLVLLMLDVKMTRVEHSAKALAGESLAKALLQYLYKDTARSVPGGNITKGSDIRILISIDHVYDYDFVLGFQNEMESRKRDWIFQELIGWDIGLNDPLFAIEGLWKRFDTVKNIWQGDGRSNCVSPFYNLARLSQIVKRRDNMLSKSYIRKVYQWTVDLTVNIRTALRSKVDAILTNNPERIVNVMKEREFVEHYRLAGTGDSPWEVAVVKGARPLGNIPAGIRNPPLPLRLANGAGDMLNSFTKYVGDFLRHRTPIKYLFLATYQKNKHVRAGDADGGQVESMSSTSDPETGLQQQQQQLISPLTGSIVGWLSRLLRVVFLFRNLFN